VHLVAGIRETHRGWPPQVPVAAQDQDPHVLSSFRRQ
jgi:hypothetical protein